MEIFFTSDLHFGHDKEFLWGPRGFKSSEEHDEAIIKNWNSIINNGDLVYVLGDVMMGADCKRNIEKINSLNGRIAICRGNHDTNNKMTDYMSRCSNVDQRFMDNETYANIIKSGKWSFYISHRPTIMTDLFAGVHGSKSICLHGHTHSKDKFEFLKFCCYNVALDAHENKPVHIETIKDDLRIEIPRIRAEHEKMRKMLELQAK